MRRPISIWILEVVLVFLISTTLWYAVSAFTASSSVMETSSRFDRVRPLVPSLALRLIVVPATLWSLHFSRKSARVLAPLAPLILIVIPSLLNLSKFIRQYQGFDLVQAKPELVGAVSFLIVAIGFATILSLRIFFGKEEKRFLLGVQK